MEDRILEYRASALASLTRDYRNVYRVQGRIELRGEEDGAELPGGYIHERKTSEQLTAYFWNAVTSNRRDYSEGSAHYTAANALRNIIDEASQPKSRQYQRRQK